MHITDKKTLTENDITWLQPGVETIWVFSFGHWYKGLVFSVGRKNVKVRYTTGSGTERIKAFPPEKLSLGL